MLLHTESTSLDRTCATQKKSADSFIRGHQATLPELTNVLGNLIVNSLCFMQQQLTKNHVPLVAWFLKEVAKVVKTPKFRAWNEKYKI